MITKYQCFVSQHTESFHLIYEIPTTCGLVLKSISFITGLKCTSQHEVIHLPISDIEIKVFIQQNFHEVRVEELTT